MTDDRGLRRHRAPRRRAHQLAEVHRRARAFGQSAEQREAARHLLQPLRLRLEHVDRLAQRLRRLAPQPRDGEADRRQRVLQLVRHLPRRLPQRRRALGLQRARRGRAAARWPSLASGCAAPRTPARPSAAALRAAARPAPIVSVHPTSSLSGRLRLRLRWPATREATTPNSSAALSAASAATTGARRVIRNSICRAPQQPFVERALVLVQRSPAAPA